MCVAGLNVSTQACNHRWYHLVRSCDPATNLANCSGRLRLEGWETRVEECPFCNGDERAVDESTHRLFGRTSSTNSMPSCVSTVAVSVTAGPSHRRGSSATMSTLSRQSSADSDADIDRVRRHQLRNDRLLFYLTTDPHEVLPSAKKNYPTYPSFPASLSFRNSSKLDQNTGSDSRHLINSGGAFARGWKKSMQLGKGLFRSGPV